MLPARIKSVYMSQAFGMVLAVTALFLMGNIAYLNTVRDEKLVNVEMVSVQLEEAQLALQKAGHDPLKAVLPHHGGDYGELLKESLSILKAQGQGLNVEAIQLKQEQTEPDEKAPRGHKKAPVKTMPALTIAGVIEPKGDLEPYAQLNEAIDRIQQKTRCQFSLSKVATDLPQADLEDPGNQPLEFKLRIEPLSQSACSKALGL